MEPEIKEHAPGEILIIDDAPASLQLLADLLEKAGYAVRTAQDGEKGLLSVQARAPSLILLDVRMPGMDGFEVCRRLKADPDTAGVPVIFLTALQDAGSRIRGFQLGAVDYITKPYEAEEALVRVRTHIELYNLQTSLKNEVQFRTVKLEQEIAERKQAEEALRQSEARLQLEQDNLQSIIGSMADGVYIVNADYDIEYINPVIEKTFGPTGGRKCYEYFHERMESCPWCKNQEVFAGKPVRWEWTSQKTGQTFDLFDAPLHNADGHISKIEFFHDITDLKRAEKLLQEKTSFLRNLIDSSTDYVFAKDMELRTILCNRIFARAVGKSVQDLIGKTDLENGWDPVLVKGDAARGIKGYEQDDLDAIAGNTVRSVDQLHVDGELHFVDTVKLPLRDDAGNTIGMFGVSRDITEKRETENALAESELHFRTLTSVSPVGIFHTDAQGLGIYVNERWCEIAGISQEQAKGTGWAQAVHPDDREWVQAKWYEAAAKNLLFKEEFRFQRPDGEAIWVLSLAASEKGADGEAASYVGTVTDITERKRIEEEAKSAHELLEASIRQMPVAYIQFDDRFHIVEWNKAAENIFGFTRDEVLGKYPIGLFVQEEIRPIIEEVMRKLLDGVVADYSASGNNMRKDGAVISCRWHNWPLVGRDGKITGVLCMAEDVTERMRAEEALHASEERYRRLFADSAAVMLILDPADGRIVDANVAACDYYGYTQAQMRAMRITDINTLSLEQVQAEMARAMERKKKHFEFCHRLANGEVRDVETSSGPIEIEGRTLLLSIVMDVTERKQAERRMRESEERFRLMADSALALIWLSGPDKLCTWFNKGWLDFTGRTMEQEIGDGWVEGVHPDDLQHCLDVYNSHFDRHEMFRMEYRLKRHDGEYRWIYDSGMPRLDEKGNFLGYIGTCFDITERKLMEETLRLQSEITANAAEGIALVKADDGIIHYANQQFEMLFGYAPGELTGKPISCINAPTEKSPQETAAEILRLLEEYGVWSGEVLSQKKDGTTLWTSANVSTFRHPELGTLLITYQRNITEKKKTEETIWKQANFDTLTGLPNRHMFRNRLEEELKKASRASQKMALMFIDLDRFKEVNDTLGHDMGDLLLEEASRRIIDCVRATDMVARMGGDEFTVILTDITDISSIERVAQSILQRLAEPFHLKNDIVFVSGSIGITLYPEDATEIEGLLKNADQTMYVAKNLGRNRHSYFTHELQEAAQARLKLINDLRGALAANQFRVYFQPIVEMDAGSIRKAEALIRWQHPERGLVGPAEFIQLAEETGLIFEIGDWVFQESARWAKRWRELFHPEFQVSVNKSPVQFYKDGEEHSAWLAYLRDLGLPGQSLVVEITEGLLMGAEPVIGDALFTLRDAGVQISIDDFGTGYSSLSYLSRFHIDYLKIDQSFTRNLTPDSNDMALSEAIIVMAHKLGLKVIAEGVETEHQRDLLFGAGCDYAQGYLYSRPVPPEEFEKLLKQA